MKVAHFDAEGIYLGEIEIDRADFDPKTHVDAAEYGGSCDLPLGEKMPKYRWDGKRFVPVHPHQEEFARDMQKIIEFVAKKSTKDPEMNALVKKHFPTEHRMARRRG